MIQVLVSVSLFVFHTHVSINLCHAVVIVKGVALEKNE